MPYHEPVSTSDDPRHPHQEIVDLLATAFLRLREKARANEGEVDLGFGHHQRVHANPSQRKGVCQ